VFVEEQGDKICIVKIFSLVYKNEKIRKKGHRTVNMSGQIWT